MYLLVPVPSRLHGLSGYVLVPTGAILHLPAHSNMLDAILDLCGPARLQQNNCPAQAISLNHAEFISNFVR